jgi:hypothetical protein
VPGESPFFVQPKGGIRIAGRRFQHLARALAELTHPAFADANPASTGFNVLMHKI